ncbi:hypothetical protein PRIPAC_71269 [Pristionchus pacificus]|uniref:Uncharacterized protein n=1 Tax=Pristionchus pacificus TaxID=54126 RepID=A0A2A6C764_PRIPA|nr:hypothetical protein PRIPAC_71269 [Pristionchus pacificus]|eukprot:PDM74035.1 hypothetical protein PRIPAC_41391 [Pristionchus pacificus]
MTPNPEMMIPPHFPTIATPPLLAQPTIIPATTGPSTIESTLAHSSEILSNFSLQPTKEERKLTLDDVPTSYVALWIGIGAFSVFFIVGLYIGCRRMNRVPPPDAPWESEYSGGYDRIGY